MPKRLFDLLGAAAALLLLSPLLLLVALLIKLDSPGPVFFRQERVGRHGVPFHIHKFRTMRAGAPGLQITVGDDPRITRVGRFLRRTSIDELPQLLNVLKGDMSLVGPRPDVPAQRSLYSDADWALRCSVRPGITGLAQALLRSQATESQRRELDLRYARERSLWLDLKIIGLTLGRLSGKGSN